MRSSIQLSLLLKQSKHYKRVWIIKGGVWIWTCTENCADLLFLDFPLSPEPELRYFFNIIKQEGGCVIHAEQHCQIILIGLFLTHRFQSIQLPACLLGVYVNEGPSLTSAISAYHRHQYHVVTPRYTRAFSSRAQAHTAILMTELFSYTSVKKNIAFEQFYQADHLLIFGHWCRLYEIHFASVNTETKTPQTQDCVLKNIFSYADCSLELALFFYIFILIYKWRPLELLINHISRCIGKIKAKGLTKFMNLTHC